MELNINYSNEFEISTMAHGIIKFDDLTMWRSTLIDNELVNIQKMTATEIILVIAKNCIKEFRGIIVLKPEEKENLKKIKIDFTHDELLEFSTKFLEKNKYLTGEEDDRFSISFGDGEAKPLEPDKDLVTHKWPDDPIEKLKEAWIIQRKKQEKFVNHTLGLVNFKAFEGLTEFARKQQDLISGIVNPFKMPPIVKPFYDTQIQESMRSIEESQRRIHEHRASVDAAQLEVPELLENLMLLQREMYETSTELQRAANKYLDDQITLAKNNSNTAGKQSIVAIIIASVGLIASVVFGIIQITISIRPNEQLKQQTEVLEKILLQNNNIDKSTDKKYERIINEINKLPVIDYTEKLNLIYTELQEGIIDK